MLGRCGERDMGTGALDLRSMTDNEGDDHMIVMMKRATVMIFFVQ